MIRKQVLVGLLSLFMLSTSVMADDNTNSDNNNNVASATASNNGSENAASNSTGSTSNGGVIASPSDKTNTSSTFGATNAQEAIANPYSSVLSGEPNPNIEKALRVSYIYSGFVGFGLYCGFPQEDLKIINDRFNYLVSQMNLSKSEMTVVQKTYLIDTGFAKTKGPASSNTSCADFRKENDALVEYIKLGNQNGMKPLFLATQLDPATGKPIEASDVQANIENSQKQESHKVWFIGLGVLVLLGIGYSVWKKYY